MARAIGGLLVQAGIVIRLNRKNPASRTNKKLFAGDLDQKSTRQYKSNRKQAIKENRQR
jgi:hypothetical protein